MKKQIMLIVGITLLVFSFAACGSSPKAAAVAAGPKKLGGVPDFVNDAYLSASEDVIIGVGAYKTGGDAAKISTGKTFAEARARADISRQLNTIVKNMITDYTAQSEMDPKAAISFQENISINLSKAELKGSKTIKMNTDENGVLWVVMDYSKSAAIQDFNAAQAAAKLKVPQAKALDASARMDAAFDKLAGGGPNPETP